MWFQESMRGKWNEKRWRQWIRTALFKRIFCRAKETPWVVGEKMGFGKWRPEQSLYWEDEGNDLERPAGKAKSKQQKAGL